MSMRPSEPDGARLVSPTACHPVLDPMVQTFLDRHAEGSLEALPRAAARKALHLLLPARSRTRPLPVLVYLQEYAAPTREPAMQRLADQTGWAVLLHAFAPAAGARAVEQGILGGLDALGAEASALGIDPRHMAMGGDGLGALAATAFASRKGQGGHRPALLVLATPMLDRPATGFCTAWLSTGDAEARGEAAMLLAGVEGWPGSYPRERLQKMPPTVLVTAEMDPFRDGAEAFARRLMAAEGEVSASRMLGTVHDFTWLPGLVHTGGALGAQCILAGALLACGPDKT